MSEKASGDRGTGRFPRVFVGSSTEARSVADAVVDEIERAAEKHPELAMLEVEPWDLVKTAETVFDTLFRATEAFDFGIFVLAPDDEVISRGTAQAPRATTSSMNLACSPEPWAGGARSCWSPAGQKSSSQPTSLE